MADGASSTALPEILDHRSSYLLSRAADAALRTANEHLSPLGFQTRHYGVMAVLEAQDAPAQRTVADTLGIDRATVVGLVDDLDKLGLARRVKSTEDRRANVVRLTAKGRQVLARAHRLMAACEEEFLGVLPSAEQRELLIILHRLIAGIS
jgi:DNA-binding MarR family transcriptional regulator